VCKKLIRDEETWVPLNLCGIQAKVHNYNCTSSADVIDVVDFVPPSGTDGYEAASPRFSQDGITDCSQESDVERHGEILNREKRDQAEDTARPPAKKTRKV
tara:strand:+ start:116 stop:418 length:303 start_codon:yes stop_codon:yes gene_type:complete